MNYFNDETMRKLKFKEVKRLTQSRQQESGKQNSNSELTNSKSQVPTQTSGGEMGDVRGYILTRVRISPKTAKPFLRVSSWLYFRILNQMSQCSSD